MPLVLAFALATHDRPLGQRVLYTRQVTAFVEYPTTSHFHLFLLHPKHRNEGAPFAVAEYHPP